MLTVVAPVTTHVKVELSPVLIDVGLAVKAVMTGMPAAVTETVAEAVESPALLVVVRVYVVVEDGVTATLPEDDTIPTLGLMDTDVARETFHDSVEELPEVIEVGLAVKLSIAGGPDGVTVIVVDVVEGPVEFVAVIV